MTVICDNCDKEMDLISVQDGMDSCFLEFVCPECGSGFCGEHKDNS